MHGYNDVQKETFFEMAAKDRGTRGNSLKIQKRHSRLNIRKNSFTQRVVNPWNKLPNSAVCAKSVNDFKNQVDAQLSRWYNKYTYGVGADWHHQIVS